MTAVLAINGSYRDDGTTDQVVEIIALALRDQGVDVETVLLREYPIEFCLNCRECTQKPGTDPGTCVHHDGMQTLVDKIEHSDALIFASPTNFGSVTALFKRFMERLVVYGYWPWGQKFPVFRKAKLPKKKALLVSSCAAPSILGKLFYDSPKQLKTAAKTVGAKPVGTILTGMIATQPRQKVPDKIAVRATKLAMKLIS